MKKLDPQMQEIVDANGYKHARQFDDGTIVALMELAFTVAIVSDLNMYGYGDRWCYHNYAAAKKALDAWNGEGEPDGWHRHPPSGRRRDVATGEEWVNP